MFYSPIRYSASFRGFLRKRILLNLVIYCGKISAITP